MCQFCNTQLVIPDKSALETGLLSDDEICSKHIHIRFPKYSEEAYELHELKGILKSIEDNFSQFVKLHYFSNRKKEKNSFFMPYDVDYLDSIDDCTFEIKSTCDRLTASGFKAHCNLLSLIKSYILHVEQIKAKKRERRLKHKENKKEKKLQTKN